MKITKLTEHYILKEDIMSVIGVNGKKLIQWLEKQGFKKTGQSRGKLHYSKDSGKNSIKVLFNELDIRVTLTNEDGSKETPFEHTEIGSAVKFINKNLKNLDSGEFNDKVKGSKKLFGKKPKSADEIRQSPIRREYESDKGTFRKIASTKWEFTPKDGKDTKVISPKDVINHFFPTDSKETKDNQGNTKKDDLGNKQYDKKTGIVGQTFKNTRELIKICKKRYNAVDALYKGNNTFSILSQNGDSVGITVEPTKENKNGKPTMYQIKSVQESVNKNRRTDMKINKLLESNKLKEGITNTEPVVKFQGKSSHTFTKDKKWEVDFDEAGNILARTRHGKPSYFKGHINDKTNDFPSTDEDNIILAAREQHGLKFGNKNEAFEKDGGPFWYFTKHGIGPGMLPKGVNVVDTKEDDNFGTYIALDKVLSTQELKDYELKEKKPDVKEGYSHFEFTSGSNPYIAKTKDEVERIKRSRGNSARYVGSINGIDYYKVDDSEKDLFRVDESKQLNETEYGKDELWNQINNSEWAYNTLSNKVKAAVEKGLPKERIVYIVRNAIASMKDAFGRCPTTQAERLELARDFVEDELQGYSFEDGDTDVLPWKRTGTWSKLGEAFKGYCYYPLTRLPNGRNICGPEYDSLKDAFTHAILNGYEEVAKEDTNLLNTNPTEDIYSVKELESKFPIDIIYFKKYLFGDEESRARQQYPDYTFADTEMMTVGYKFLNEDTNITEAFKPSDSGIQSVKCYNRFNYTIQELRVDNDNKTFERGNFTAGKPDKKTKNRQEFEDVVDTLKELGYTEIKSGYNSMRNKSRKGNPTNVEEGYELSPRIDYNPSHLRDDEGKIMADKWYASKWPDDEVGIEQLQGITLDDALKDRSILGHCDTQVRERVYAQLDKYIPLSKESPMYKEKNESTEQGLTYEELMELARKNYNKGGDSVYECWGKEEFNEYVKEFGPITKEKAYKLFGMYDEVNRDRDGYMIEGKSIKEARRKASDPKQIEKAEKSMLDSLMNGAYNTEWIIQDAKMIYGITHQEATDAFKKAYNRYMIESGELDENLLEGSYGGAFDIADDQYFTREDLDSFAEEVLNHINETFKTQFDIASCYIDDGVLEVCVTNDEYGDYIHSEKIDMRKIKEPWHLKRAYAFEFASQLINDITQSNDGLVESLDDDVDDLSYYYSEEDIIDALNDIWEEIASKQVPDSDGFYTDYTMYRNINTGEYVFVFGDKDIYRPEYGYFDWECETEQEATEWFDNYNGFDDFDDETFSED